MGLRGWGGISVSQEGNDQSISASSSRFHKPFIVEIDVYFKDMGVVLMQKGRPLTFFSKALATKHRGLSTYEKEYMIFYQL